MFMKTPEEYISDSSGPVSPSPELVRQWQREADHNKPMFYQVAVMAAHWGYKQRCLEEPGETRD